MKYLHEFSEAQSCALVGDSVVMYAISHVTVTAETGILAFADLRDRVVHQMLNEVYLLPAVIFPNDMTQIRCDFLPNSGEKKITIVLSKRKQSKSAIALFSATKKISNN